MTGVSIQHENDQLVVAKQASDARHRERLRREASFLGQLDHPNVVELTRFDDEDETVLVTRFAGTENFDSQMASLADFASLVGVVDDLHRIGVTHNRIEQEHIIVSPTDRLVLCGFAEASWVTTEGRQHDRNALAAMIDEATDSVPAADQRAMAEAASALREPALPLSAAIRHLNQPTPVTPKSRPRIAPSLRHLRYVAASISFGAMVMTSTTVVTGPATPKSSPLSTATAKVTEPSTLDDSEPLPGDEADQPTAIAGAAADGPVVEHNGRRYQIGQAGDLVVIGDWQCTGSETIALLRPATGEVAVFDAWPDPQQATTPQQVVTVDGAIDFVLNDDSCGDLRVRTTHGSRLIEQVTP